LPKSFQPSGTITTTEKIKEDIRTMSGWFFNFSTTTSKTSDQIISQLTTILSGEQYTLSADKTVMQCEIDVHSVFWTEKKKLVNHEVLDIKSHKQNMIGVRIEINRVPRSIATNIQFKRTSGSVWNFKKVLNKMLSQMQL
jgi:MAP/microtubule affinity-regulating kinase